MRWLHVRFFEERVRDVLARDELRFDERPAEAESFSRAASTRLSSASARLPAALAALFAVPPTAFAAPATCPAVCFAELLSWDSFRFAAERFRVAAAFFAAACRRAFVGAAIDAPLGLSQKLRGGPSPGDPSRVSR